MYAYPPAATCFTAATSWLRSTTSGAIFGVLVARIPIWPTLFLPQPHTSPLGVTAKLVQEPAPSAAILRPLSGLSSAGRPREEDSPRPSWPTSPCPHAWTWPSLAMPSECARPAASATQCTVASTCAGGCRGCCLPPVPSCPAELSPNAHSCPSLVSASECAAPATTCATFCRVNGVTSIGLSASRVPATSMPSCAALLCPHA
mmetsp:Transcript_34079/g.85851  ORF Transcript_34079/g.85851 Transcript_34079/m.85851 type:complete len:203 (+) Transcript_34079:3495-4103(+)